MVERSLGGRAAAALLLLVGVGFCLVGCSAEPPSGGTGGLAQVDPLHGGTVTPLPNQAGYVETIAESADTPGAPARKGSSKVKVVAYFLNSNANGPIATAPSEVTFIDPSGKPYKLQAKGGDARFESETINAAHDVNGEVKARIGSETVTVSVRSR